MNVDVTTLHRVQFALTIMFHYLFPPLSIGLGVLLVVMEGAFLRTGDRRYEAMARFWTRVFAVNFAMGVATGIVMEFQFGTNWARYSRFVGDVFGSALAAEGIFAFFLESGFLAVLVFGWDRVSPRMHFVSTIMVALGSIFSSVWIVIANSWQQTPAGHHIVGEGSSRRAEIVDFWAMVFSPSSMPRLLHVLLGAVILGAFFVMSVSAHHVLRARRDGGEKGRLAGDIARRAFTLALVVGALGSVGEIFAGHLSADVVAHHQPAKLAAFEGHFHTGTGGSPMYVVGWPDVKAEEVRFGVAVPGLLSFLVHQDFSTPVAGLDQIPEADRPPVRVPFVTYHLMIGLGVTFVGLTALGLVFLRRGKLFETPWLLKVFVFAVAGPYVANEAGWVSAEVGRQPWVVYGLLRTSEGISRSVPASHVVASMVGFAAVYALLFAVWVHVLNAKIQHGPDLDEARPLAPGEEPRASFLDVAAERAEGRASLTLAHEGPPPSRRGE